MWLKQIFVALIALLTVDRVNACECFSIDSISAKELANEVEFVIIGHAVKNVEFYSEVNRMWDQREQGYNVLIEVDSVVKGNVKSKNIVIKQFGGNCDQIFEFGEQYLIIGNQLEKFINKTPKRPKTIEGEIPLTSVPPPPPSIHDTKVYLFNNEKEEVDYWNKLANESIIINTSMCSSFAVESWNAKYFLEQ